MFGYVRPSLSRLTEEDRGRFQAAYCGLCRVLGARYGTAARCILNYDLTFLAVLLWPAGAAEAAEHRRCAVHPLAGRDGFPENEALALAADYSVILTWWQLRDALEDPGRGKGRYRLAAMALRGAYEKARDLRPGFDRSTQEQLRRLRALEQAQCASLDEPADTFARLLAGVATEVDEPPRRRVLEELLYHLGRWVYLIDAVDDLAEDLAAGGYNPLICRFGLETGRLTGAARESVVVSLDASIRRMAAAFELWDFGPWSGVIRSVVYEGLFGVGSAVLEGTFHAAGGPFGPAARKDEPR